MVTTKGEGDVKGPVAQWITRLTTDQKIPGSTPGRLEVTFLFLIFCLFLFKYVCQFYPSFNGICA
jgi:hypothetical protein